MLDYELYGLKPAAIIHQPALHLASTVLLFWILKKMTGTVMEERFGGPCCLPAPLHVESVAWVS